MAIPALGRPWRLLNLQKSPASKKAIANTNATTSPFLKLPVEIRQRIYNYALGGHALHVASRVIECRDIGPDPLVVCRCTHDYDDSDHSVMRSHPLGLKSLYVESSRRIFLHLDTHRQSFQDSSTQACFPIDLNLLQTCRQVYHEAVLVPFKKNIFALIGTRPLIHNGTSLSRFMDSLVPTQLKAITNLIVQPTSMSVCTGNYILRFKGLTALGRLLLSSGK